MTRLGTFRIWQLGGVAVLASCTASSAGAAECLYHAVVADTRVVSDDGAVIDPSEWTSSPRCERLAVATGRVRVARHEADGRIVKVELGPRARLASSKDDAADSMLNEFQVMLAGDQRVRDGRARSAADGFDAVTVALPHGKVVRSGGIEVALPLVPDELGAVFTLTKEGGSIVFTVPLRTASFVVPENALQTGQRYEWTFKVAGQTLRGSFVVVDAAARDAVMRDALASLPGATADPLLFEATTLRDAGYDLDARRKMREWLDR
jgi:hypothetical protein